MPFAPQAVTSRHSIPYSWQVSRIGTGRLIEQVQRRFVMKHSIIARTFTIAALNALALSVAPTANAHEKACSDATLKGTFAQKGTGVIITPPAIAGPMANVGTLTFDGNGAITGTVINSLNGNMVPATETGTYKVNPDCTGTYTVQISPLGITGNAFFVIDDSGNELQIITTDPGVVITCVARRQFPVVRRRAEPDSGDDSKQ
jgi:hypothetical protein